jgi:ABC-type multidrug transport system fused ATPase/permease subunit
MAKQLFRFILLHRWQWRLLIVLVSFIGALLGILGPYFQKHFIDALLNIPSKDIFGFENQWSPLGLVVVAFFCLVLTQALGFIATFLGMREAIILQRNLSERIYEKTLSLRPDSLQGRTVGEMVAIYATDVMGATIFLEQSIPAGASTLFPLILAPLGLKWLFGMPFNEVLLVMGAVITINSILAFRQSFFFMRFKQLAAERLGLVNEWILNIKALKILGWVEAYEEKIHQLRVTEPTTELPWSRTGKQ